jgi:hypothetical protein
MEVKCETPLLPKTAETRQQFFFRELIRPGLPDESKLGKLFFILFADKPDEIRISESK